MELKQTYRKANKSIEELLIVPYGIETRVLIHASGKPLLLIVPYGIETMERYRPEFIRTSF